MALLDDCDVITGLLVNWLETKDASFGLMLMRRINLDDKRILEPEKSTCTICTSNILFDLHSVGDGV